MISPMLALARCRWAYLGNFRRISWWQTNKYATEYRQQLCIFNTKTGFHHLQSNRIPLATSNDLLLEISHGTHLVISHGTPGYQPWHTPGYQPWHTLFTKVRYGSYLTQYTNQWTKRGNTVVVQHFAWPDLTAVPFCKKKKKKKGTENSQVVRNKRTLLNKTTYYLLCHHEL